MTGARPILSLDRAEKAKWGMSYSCSADAIGVGCDDTPCTSSSSLRSMICGGDACPVFLLFAGEDPISRWSCFSCNGGFLAGVFGPLECWLRKACCPRVGVEPKFFLPYSLGLAEPGPPLARVRVSTGLKPKFAAGCRVLVMPSFPYTHDCPATHLDHCRSWRSKVRAGVWRRDVVGRYAVPQVSPLTSHDLYCTGAHTRSLQSVSSRPRFSCTSELVASGRHSSVYRDGQSFVAVA
jgi:hypothetical protein